MAMEQAWFAHFALPYLSHVAPTQGNWHNVPMGEDVLLDWQASTPLRDACQALIEKLLSSNPSSPGVESADVAERQNTLVSLQTLLTFADRLGDGGFVLLVAHWPERDITEAENLTAS